ncbi:HDOD domain-containing protein [Methylomicrobium lacus]|uniref:HDOD domain-containing protein n=1 Tax=Methylomicrobium lacus TaxID=136992 RepID=UPI0035A93702
MENAVLSILSRVDLNNLPVVPKVLLDLIRVTQRVEVNFKELASIIGQDASLSSKVLAVANSSYYRQWGEITDLNRVIIVLGLSTVKTIAITRSVQQYFSQMPRANHDSLELIWYRSLTCAHLAHKLAKLTAYPFPEEAYLTGLLHRIGQLVLLDCFPQDYPLFLAQHLDGREGELEGQLFGARHNEIGGQLIESWNLQSFISDAVCRQYQAFDQVADSAPLVKIINLAGQIASIDTADRQDVLDLADRLFGINEPLLDDMLEEVVHSVRQSADELGIMVVHAEGKGLKCLTLVQQRETIRGSLGERIKSMMLSTAVRQQLDASPELNHVVGVIQKDLCALFGFQVAAVFLFRSETNDLVGVARHPEEDFRWSSVIISLSPDRSLLAQCFLQRRLLHSFEAGSQPSMSVVDRQICHMLGAEGLMLIPLYEGEKDVGVVAAGLSQSDAQAMASKAEFMLLFSREAARALLNLSSSERTTLQKLEEMRENYRLQAKKLAHEASNPLSIIQNYLYLLAQRLGGENANEIRIIQDEMDRVGKLLSSLPDMIDDMPNDESGRVDVNALIIDLGKLFQTGLCALRGINIDLKLDHAIPSVFISQNKLKQLLINLIKNALEASRPGSKITIATRDNVDFGSGGLIEIRVEDEGPGLPQEVLRQLYAPVVSSKGNNHAGLGLTICKCLIDELKGMIRCDSSAATGTVFHVFLPRAPTNPIEKCNGELSCF